MANCRRLATEEIQIIFDCFRYNKAPPEHLKFQILTAGASGMKLSPPPYEFEGNCICFQTVCAHISENKIAY